jgi:hypothetical protein
LKPVDDKEVDFAVSVVKAHQTTSVLDRQKDKKEGGGGIGWDGWD